MKDNQLSCLRARQGPAAIPAASKGMRHYTKGTFQIWQQIPHTTQHCTAPWPHHVKSRPKPEKKPVITVTPNGQSCSPLAKPAAHITHLDEDRGKWHCLGKVDRTTVTFLAQAEEPPPPPLQHVTTQTVQG